MVKGLRFRDCLFSLSGLGVVCLVFRVQGVLGLGFRVLGSGFQVWCLGFMVWGFCSEFTV